MHDVLLPEDSRPHHTTRTNWANHCSKWALYWFIWFTNGSVPHDGASKAPQQPDHLQFPDHNGVRYVRT